MVDLSIISYVTVYQRVNMMIIPFNIPYKYWLVVWNIWIIFPYIGNVIIPTDELIFFRGVGRNH